MVPESLPSIPMGNRAEPPTGRNWLFRESEILLEAALLFLYPPRCRCCDASLDHDDGIRICQACWQKAELIRGDLCSSCGYPISDLNPERRGHCARCPSPPVHFDAARAAAAYDGPIRSLVHALKFRYHRNLAGFLALFLTPIVERLKGEVDVLVPVPLHWTRHRWREFNQSHLLAKELRARFGIPLETKLLRRSRRTRPQSRTAGPAAKRRNVRGAFRVRDPERVTGLRVLLIDDVYTSGSTVNECARMLKKAGAHRIEVVTVARRL